MLSNGHHRQCSNQQSVAWQQTEGQAWGCDETDDRQHILPAFLLVHRARQLSTILMPSIKKYVSKVKDEKKYIGKDISPQQVFTLFTCTDVNIRDLEKLRVEEKS